MTRMTDVGARLAAIGALTRMTQVELGAYLGMSVRTFQRVAEGKRELTASEVQKLEELGIPAWFLRDGFNGAGARPDDGAVTERLEAVASVLADAAGRLEALAEAQASARTPVAPPQT